MRRDATRTTPPSAGPPAEARRLYLIRHGEVSYFAADGTAIEPYEARLTGCGGEQARRLGAELASAGIDRLLTSALPRAVETAAILAERLGLDPVVEAAWNELQPGDLTLVDDEELRGVIVDAHRRADEPGARFFGGERFADFADRVQGALHRLLDDRSWTTAAAVTHDPVGRFVLARAVGLGLAGMRLFEQDQACVNVIDWLQGPAGPEAVIRLVNGTADDLAKTGPREPALQRFYRSYTLSRLSP